MQVLKSLLLIFLPSLLFAMGGNTILDERTEETKAGAKPTSTTTGIEFDQPGSAFYTSRNNSIRLTGDYFGTGKYVTQELRKTVDVKLVEKNENFSIGKAYLVRNRKQEKERGAEAIRGAGAGLIIAVKNKTSQLACAILVEKIAYKDTGGYTLKAGRHPAILFGAFNSLASDDRTCLNPGEAGYVFTSLPYFEIYPLVDHIEIQRIRVLADGKNNTISKAGTEASLLPIRYSLKDPVIPVSKKHSKNLEVLIKNPGPRPLKVSSRSIVLFLDEAGLPLYVNSLSPVNSDGHAIGDSTVPGGGAVKMSTPVLYDGLVSSIRPILSAKTTIEQEKERGAGTRASRPISRTNFAIKRAALNAVVLVNLEQSRKELAVYKQVHSKDFPKEAAKATTQLKVLDRTIVNVKSMKPGETKKAIQQNPTNLKLGFDEQYYLAQNPDVAEAINRGEFGGGFEHFEKNGHKEGRKGSAESLPYLVPTMESLGEELHAVKNNGGVSEDSNGISFFEQRLTNLVNAKRMIVDAYKDPDLPERNGDLVYAPIEGEFVDLFVNGASLDDIKHGYAGNTMVTGLLASMAVQDPRLIGEMITDHGDGTYTVHFKGLGDVIVDSDLPLFKGQPVFAHTPDNELWPAIIEKAYAQAKGVGYEATTDINNKSNGYSNSDLSQAMMDILGTDGLDTYSLRYLRHITPESVQQTFESGTPMIAVAETGDLSDEVYDYGLAPGHSYAVVGTRVGKDGQMQVHLYNPWGRHEPGVGVGSDGNAFATDGRHDGVFWMNWDDFDSHFSSVTMKTSIASSIGIPVKEGGAVFGNAWHDALEDIINNHLQRQ